MSARSPEHSISSAHSTPTITAGDKFPVNGRIEPLSSTPKNPISASLGNIADIPRQSHNPDRLSTIRHVLSTIKSRQWCAVCWSISFLGGGHGMSARWSCQHSRLQKERLQYRSNGVCHRCGVTNILCNHMFQKPPRPMCRWSGIVVPVVIHAWNVPELRRKLVGMLTGESLRERMTMNEWKLWLGGETQMACRWSCAAMAVFDSIVMINEVHCSSSSDLLCTFFNSQESNSRERKVPTNANPPFVNSKEYSAHKDRIQTNKSANRLFYNSQKSNPNKERIRTKERANRPFFNGQKSKSRKQQILTTESANRPFYLPPKPCLRKPNQRKNSGYKTNRLAAIKKVLSSITRNKSCSVCWSLKFLDGHRRVRGYWCPQHSRLRSETPPKMFTKGHICICYGVPGRLCERCLSHKDERRYPIIVFPVVLNAWKVRELRRLLVTTLVGEGLSMEMSEDAWKVWLRGETQMACRWPAPAMAAFDVVVMANEGYRV